MESEVKNQKKITNFGRNFMASRQILLGFVVAFAAVVSDLASKKLIFEMLNEASIQSGLNKISLVQLRIFDFFSLVYVENRGVSFGMFNNSASSNQIFTFLQGAIASIVLILMVRSRSFVNIIAYGLIFGGAMGNVIDRALRGGVMDFLDFHIGTYHWPAFNLADSFVFVGVAALLILEFFVVPKNNLAISKSFNKQSNQ